MPSKYWIKLYHEILDDPKMGRLPDNLWRRVTELFLIAGEKDAEGFLPSVADMAWRLRLDESVLQTELEQLETIGIMEQNDGSWFVTNFAKRQAPVSNVERQARYRQRKRTDNGSVTDDVTSRNTDTDTDTETDSDTNGASAPPVNLDEWQEYIRSEKNRPAALMRMLKTLYPKHDAVEFGYVGKTAQTVGGAGRLAALLWQAQCYHPDGDILRYCMGMAKQDKRAPPPSRHDLSISAAEELLQEIDDGDT